MSLTKNTLRGRKNEERETIENRKREKLEIKPDEANKQPGWEGYKLDKWKGGERKGERGTEKGLSGKSLAQKKERKEGKN